MAPRAPRERTEQMTPDTLEVISAVLLAAQLVVLILSLLGLTTRIPSEASSRRKWLLQLRLTHQGFGELYDRLFHDLGERDQLLLNGISLSPALLVLIPALRAGPWVLWFDSIWISVVIWGTIIVYLRREVVVLARLLNRKKVGKGTRRALSLRYQSVWAALILWSMLLMTLFGISVSIPFLGDYPGTFVGVYAATILATSLSLSIWIYPRAWSLIREIENGAFQQYTVNHGPLLVEYVRKPLGGMAASLSAGARVDIGKFCIVARGSGPDAVPWSELAILRPSNVVAV